MRQRQAGNAVVFILIAIALFGALAYTFMHGAKTGQGNLTTGQAKLVAQEIINYSNTMTRAVDKLRQRGCSSDQLSFEKSPFDGSDAAYVNIKSPADLSCFLFSPAGAGVGYVVPTTGVTQPTNWVFTGSNRIDTIGDNLQSEIMMLLPFLQKEVCEQIDISLHSLITVPQDPDPWYVPFTGVYQNTNSISAVFDVTYGCIEDMGGAGSSPGQNFVYYKTLVER